MITGYLFFKVILKNDLDIKNFLKKKKIFRLVPIYYFVVMILILFVMIQTEFQLKFQYKNFFLRLTAWFFLQTNINDYIYTNNITASVTWTLKYEWLFYIFCSNIVLSK